jgi:hypothetical protein
LATYHISFELIFTNFLNCQKLQVLEECFYQYNPRIGNSGTIHGR